MHELQAGTTREAPSVAATHVAVALLPVPLVAADIEGAYAHRFHPRAIAVFGGGMAGGRASVFAAADVERASAGVAVVRVAAAAIRGRLADGAPVTVVAADVEGAPTDGGRVGRRTFAILGRGLTRGRAIALNAANVAVIARRVAGRRHRAAGAAGATGATGTARRAPRSDNTAASALTR